MTSTTAAPEELEAKLLAISQREIPTAFDLLQQQVENLNVQLQEYNARVDKDFAEIQRLISVKVEEQKKLAQEAYEKEVQKIKDLMTALKLADEQIQTALESRDFNSVSSIFVDVNSFNEQPTLACEDLPVQEISKLISSTSKPAASEIRSAPQLDTLEAFFDKKHKTFHVKWTSEVACDAYQVQMAFDSPAEESYKTVYSGPEKEAYIEDIHEFGTYHFRVRAIVGFEEGQWSSDVMIEYMEAKKVLIVHSFDSSVHLAKLENVKHNIQSASTTRLTVEFFDAHYETPSLEMLSSYDVVFVMPGYKYFNDSQQLGNVLADFADKNGKIVVTTFSNYTNGFGLHGRFRTEKYHPLDYCTHVDCDKASLGGKIQPEHPLLKNVDTFDGGKGLRSLSGWQEAVEVVACWDDGMPLISTLKLRNKNVIVSLNMFPPSNLTGDKDLWDQSTHGNFMLANSILYHCNE